MPAIIYLAMLLHALMIKPLSLPLKTCHISTQHALQLIFSQDRARVFLCAAIKNLSNFPLRRGLHKNGRHSDFYQDVLDSPSMMQGVLKVK